MYFKHKTIQDGTEEVNACCLLHTFDDQLILKTLISA